jgi:hypothetical protein
MKICGMAARLLVAAASVLAVVATAAAAELPGLPAQVVTITPPVTTFDYQTVDYGRSASSTDDRSATTTWRVVNLTGNCCENYLTTNKSGRLFDFGGSYLNYTDDAGLTWKSVQPIEPLVNGEGAVVNGPNGDVLGVEWDPYSGDHLLAFKYDAAAGKWLYNEMPLKTPFYDREWIAVVPGPFTIDGKTVPYLTFVKGGYPAKELYLYSTDGLTYTQVASKIVDRTLEGSRAESLPTVKGAALDWIQPNSNTGITPLGGASALAAPDYPGSAWARLDPGEPSWHGFTFADGSTPEGRFQVDSLARVHNVIAHGTYFTYRVSSDGGGTWRSVDVALPAGSSIEEWDFRANAAVKLAAVAVHATDTTVGVDRDFVFKLDIDSKVPRAVRVYTVGHSDANSTAGLGNDVRFDFETVTFLPNGRIAVSFLDRTTGASESDIRPALAIEQGTKLGAKIVPTTTTPVGTAQSPIATTVTVPAAGAGNRACGVTSGCIEFDALAGADNANVVVDATPSAPADVDLYLQRQTPDGGWSGDLMNGTTSALDGEHMEGGPLVAGHYRIEAHEWLGAPVLQIALQVTFYNGAGIAGT